MIGETIIRKTVFKDGTNLFHANKRDKNVVVAIDNLVYQLFPSGSQYLCINAHDVKTGKLYFTYSRVETGGHLFMIPDNNRGHAIYVDLSWRA